MPSPKLPLEAARPTVIAARPYRPAWPVWTTLVVLTGAAFALVPLFDLPPRIYVLPVAFTVIAVIAAAVWQLLWHHGNADVRGLAVTGAEIVLLGDGRAYRSLRRGRGWTLSPAQLRVLPVLKQSGGYAAGGSLHIARFDLAAVRDACVAHGWRWHEPGHAPRSRAVRVRKAPAASPTPVLLRSAAEAARRRSLRHPLAW